MRDLGKLIVAKGFKKLPKVQKIAQSGHTGQPWWRLGEEIHPQTSLKTRNSTKAQGYFGLKFSGIFDQLGFQWKQYVDRNCYIEQCSLIVLYSN